MNSTSGLDHVGTDHENHRELFVIELSDPAQLPPSFRTASKHFVALIVWDAANASFESIAQLARRLMDAGGVYFCTWGPDCERVHDVIDEVWVGNGIDPQFDETLMTTWHSDEPLADAVWFALFAAFPIDTYFKECRSVVAVCIGHPQFAAEIRAAFVDPEHFNNELYGPDDEPE